jgi:hypothetical protein
MVTNDAVADNDQTSDSLESLRKQIDRWVHLHLLNDMVESWRLVNTVHADTLSACGLTPTDRLHRVVHTLHHELGLSLDAKTFCYIAEAEMCRPSRHSSLFARICPSRLDANNRLVPQPARSFRVVFSQGAAVEFCLDGLGQGRSRHGGAKRP